MTDEKRLERARELLLAFRRRQVPGGRQAILNDVMNFVWELDAVLNREVEDSVITWEGEGGSLRGLPVDVVDDDEGGEAW